MNWEDIKNRKEDSIRESTNNPVKKSFELNGKTYNSFTDFLDSDEYNESLNQLVIALEEYAKKSEDYFKSLDTDNQLLIFFHVTNTIYKNYFEESGSYRALLYTRFGFGPESYSLGMDSGMFALHNAISTPKETEERFEKLMSYLNLNLSKEQLKSARNYFEYGFDNSSKQK